MLLRNSKLKIRIMKDFIKNVFATIVGIVILMIIVGILGVISIVGMVASESASTTVKDNSVFVISLNGTMQEREPSLDPLSAVTGGGVQGLGLDKLTGAIAKAKDCDEIKGIYIEAGAFAPDTPASVEALRKALVDFKKSGKWIVAYGDLYTQMTYYVCSVADKVYINPQGMLDWHGLGGTPFFLKDALAKFGVRIQLSKVGKYKSAPETMTADGMSDANREQTMAYMNGIWGQMLADVSASRKVSKEQLNAYADGVVALEGTDKLLEMKLVDKVIYTDEVKKEIKKLLKLDDDDNVNQVSLNEVANLKAKKKDKGEEIAVYYAYGQIYDDVASKSSSGHNIVGSEMCRDLEALAADDDVKAVVLRVNSPGGSAYASEQIWHAVMNLKAKKPVVVSMGGYAASGGYYISCAADYIYAEPMTITGSIGIFGMFPDYSQLLTEKLGVKFDEVKTNKHAAFGTLARPFNEEEMSYLNAHIERGYNLFRKRVADGRKMTVDAVEQVAQGRVWVGGDAKKVKLVDDFGGINEAVAKAAKLAKLDEYHTASYPQADDAMEQFMKMLNGGGNGNYLDEQLRLTLGEYYAPFMYLKDINRQSAIQARLPYILVIK